MSERGIGFFAYGLRSFLLLVIGRDDLVRDVTCIWVLVDCVSYFGFGPAQVFFVRVEVGGEGEFRQ